MSDLKSIAIVGAGIMGRMLAWRLIKRGHKVTLFDKDAIENGTAAAYSAAGMLTPYAEIESAEPLIFQMGMEGLSLWPEWIKSLNSDVGFYQSGSLIVSHHQDKPDFQRFNQQLKYKLNNQYFLNEIDKKQSTIPKELDQKELSKLEPELATRFSSATWLPQEAWLCPKCVMSALANNLLEKNVSWFAHNSIQAFSEHTVVFGRQKYHFDQVIDCRGLGSQVDMKDLRGVRGETILLEAPEVNIRRLVRLMHPRYRLYIVPKMRDNLYLIGATQIESDDSGPITVRSALELLSAAYSMHESFAEAKIIQTQTNCRPALPNNLPEVRYHDGVIQINGLFRHGFLLAPAIAEEVALWLSDEKLFQPKYQSLFQFDLTSRSENIA